MPRGGDREDEGILIMISNVLLFLTVRHVLGCLSVETLDIDDHVAFISSLRHKMPERTPRGAAAAAAPYIYINDIVAVVGGFQYEKALCVNVNSSSRKTHPKIISDIPDTVSARALLTAEANDAAARQRILELGLQLADRSVAGQDFQTHVGDMDEVAIKREDHREGDSLDMCLLRLLRATDGIKDAATEVGKVQALENSSRIRRSVSAARIAMVLKKMVVPGRPRTRSDGCHHRHRYFPTICCFGWVNRGTVSLHQYSTVSNSTVFTRS